MNNKENLGTLTLKRFNGDEIWNITEGEFSISPRDNYYLLNIWVTSSGDLIMKPTNDNIREEEEDSDERIHPRIELQTKLSQEQYQNFIGKSFGFLIEEVPEETDDNFSNFYYHAHEETYSNQITILKKEADRYHIHSISSATDLNFYDGSKPDNEIIIDCWLEMQAHKTGYWTV
ncbi:hypothetical protein QNI19_04350 [Cytophagaceae bacterium DM2B3-1]|uniref:DUF2262 domain-containing protein n=1 Tax=Xanthocytophaga flava TaxID=3048013 RepID=A0ABT7CEK3_9BACT|nr:hypothetical protein [Xanthocytophaga flavus]MDJ1468971.1 hypothetical protein [Xanthocytophaga flavus]MDJ1492149.1 hypothetical protein [Xanthocytophaga flavus]